MKHKYSEQNEMLGKALRMQLRSCNCPTYAEQEDWKDQYRIELQAWEKGTASLDAVVTAADGRFRAWYFRSAKHHPKTHPTYPVFAAMLLNQDHFRSLFPGEVIAKLIERYGQRTGISNGSYWMPKRPNGECSFGVMLI